MTTLSPQDLELANKYGEVVNSKDGYVQYQILNGDIILKQSELAAFLAERDAQQGKAVCQRPDNVLWALKQIANLDPKNSGLIGTAVFMAKEAIELANRKGE